MNGLLCIFGHKFISVKEIVPSLKPGEFGKTFKLSNFKSREVVHANPQV